MSQSKHGKGKGKPNPIYRREEKFLIGVLLDELEKRNVITDDWAFWNSVALEFQQDKTVSNLTAFTLKKHYIGLIKGCKLPDRLSKRNWLQDYAVSNGFYQQSPKEEKSKMEQPCSSQSKRVGKQQVETDDFSSSSDDEEELTGDIFLEIGSDGQKDPRKFYFIGHEANKYRSDLEIFARKCIKSNGGEIITDEDQLDVLHNLDTFVIYFGKQKQDVLDFWDHPHQQDVYSPSLIFTSLEKETFDVSDEHLFLDRFVYLEIFKNAAGEKRQAADGIKIFPTMNIREFFELKEEDVNLIAAENVNQNLEKLSNLSKQSVQNASVYVQTVDLISKKPTTAIREIQTDEKLICDISIYGADFKLIATDSEQLLKLQAVLKNGRQSNERLFVVLNVVDKLIADKELNIKSAVQLELENNAIARSLFPVMTRLTQFVKEQLKKNELFSTYLSSEDQEILLNRLGLDKKLDKTNN